MSRYHTVREREALATLCEQFGYPVAGSIIRRDHKHIAVMDSDSIRDDPEGAGEMLCQHLDAGQTLVWIGPTAPPS